MKAKWMVVLLAIIMLGSSGCDLKPAQVKAIAQSAGMFSAIGWIAIDNPDIGAIKVVKKILVVIEEKSAEVEADATYTEIVYPELIKYIDSDKVEPQYKPAAKASTLALLGGLDVLFASHPEWKVEQDFAIQVVGAFIFGAKNGFSLDERDPMMITARDTARKRAVVLREIRNQNL